MEWDQPDFRKAFSTSIDDHVETQRLLAAQRAVRRHPLKQALLVWVIVFVFAFLLDEDEERRLPLALVQASLVSMIAIVLIPVSRRWQTHIWQTHYRTHFGPGPYATEVELGERQLIYRFDDLEQRFAWRAVRKLERTPQELRISVAHYGLIRIPTSLFADEDETRSWIQLVEQKTGLSFS